MSSIDAAYLQVASRERKGARLWAGVRLQFHYCWSGWHSRVHVVSSALQSVSHLFLYCAPLTGDRGDQRGATQAGWISYIKGLRPANVVFFFFFLNNGLTHATLLQPSGENIHSLPKDSAVVAMDLIDSIQPVCNFLEQRQRNQHSATDFYSLQNITAAWCCAVTAVKDKINTFLRDLEGKVVPSIRKRVNAGLCENLPPVLVATERWRCWVHRCTASGLWTVYGEIKWSQLAVCRMPSVKSSSSHHSLPVEPLK